MRIFRIFRRRCDGRHHRWSRWKIPGRSALSAREWVMVRTCRCSAVQRYKPRTGEASIWTQDGVDSGLLDRGMTREILEGLQ